MINTPYNLIVLGGGVGGYVAAIRSAQLGMKVLLVEKEHLGGICLNWGCIPTKSFLKSAEIFDLCSQVSEYGVNISSYNFDIKKIVERSRKVSTKLSQGVHYLLKKNNIEVVFGEGYIKNNHSIEVKCNKTQDVRNFSAEKIIVATGATYRTLEGFKYNTHIWNYKDALQPDHIPESMIVIGAGAIGIEFATFYNSMGSNVKVLEMQEHILPSEDKEISILLRKKLEEKGITFYTGVQVRQRTEESGTSVTFTMDNQEKTISAAVILVSVGITPNTKNIGIENTCAELDNRGFIIVNQNMQTKDDNIFAIGDSVDGPWFAHKALREGVISAESIASLNNITYLDKNLIPRCTYCTPQVASIGLTEQECLDQKYEIKVGKFPFYANGKVLISSENLESTDLGFAKTIFDAKTGELLGAHLIGLNATELINSYAIHKSLEGTEEDFMHYITAHPTISEVLQESVMNAYNISLHK